MALNRLVEGLIERYTFDADPTGAPPPGWSQAGGGSTHTFNIQTAPGGLQTGRAMQQLAVTTGDRLFLRDETADLPADMVVQSIMRLVGTAGANNNQPCLVIRSSTALVFAMIRGWDGGPQAFRLFSAGQTDQVSAQAIARGVDYQTRLRIRAGVAEARFYNNASAQIVALTSPGPTTAPAGKVGIYGVGVQPNHCWFDNYAIYKETKVVVTGLSDGHSIRLGTQTAASVAGTATLDYTGLFPVTTLELLDSGLTVIDSVAPAGGVWGGDEYEWLPVFVGVPDFTSPASGSRQGGAVLLQWTAMVDGVGDVTYEADWSANGVVWNSIIADTLATEADFLRPANLNGLPVFVRVRAFSEYFEQFSDYAYLDFSFEGFADYTARVLADEPVEYWRLEETAGDFLTSAVGGYDAQPNGESFAGIQTRGIDAALCKGIQTVATRDPRCLFFSSRRPRSELYVDNFTIEQWVKPEVPTSFSVPVGMGGMSADDKLIINPLHPDDAAIPALGIGLGLQIGTNGICVRQHSAGNLQPAAKYEGPISSTEWHQVVMLVRTEGFTRTIELYLDGEFCGDIVGGVYTPWTIDNVPLASWPVYGVSNYNPSLTYYYGFTYQGGIDEVSWYDYAFTPEQVALHFDAAQGEDVAPPTAFTAPTGDVSAGTPVLVEWGAAPGADAYVLDLWDGSSWVTLAETTLPQYLWTPDSPQSNAQLRVIGTVGGFGPACDVQYATSDVFFIRSSSDLAPPARRAWAFTMDGHIFYVIGSFDDMTLLYDGTTGQWCRWKTGDRRFWNMHRGIMWRGRVLAADRELPIIWELDPSTQLDEESIVITRAVTGFQPHRGDDSNRQGSLRMIARQQTGAAADASITLRYSDNGGRTWSPERTLLLTDAAARLEFRSLGRIRKPGRIWEITDTGGLIRIDGLEAILEGSDG